MKKQDIDQNENEFDPYAVDKLSRVPLVLKVLVVKYWGAGAAAFLVFMGLNKFLPSDVDGSRNLDAYLIFWVIFGLIIDFFMNKLIRMMGNPIKPTQKYIFINGSSAFTIFGNILYAALCWYIIMWGYQGFLQLIFDDIKYNALNPRLWSPENPFTFALLFTICDILLLLIKNGIIKLYRYIHFGKENKDE